MFINAIQTELARLQLHPVNLHASAEDGRLVILQGSLLRYWPTPAQIEGQWLLEILRTLPDAAGPEVVMKALCTPVDTDSHAPQAVETVTALRLFDPLDERHGGDVDGRAD